MDSDEFSMASVASNPSGDSSSTESDENENAEDARMNAENARVEAENRRVAAEKARVAAENGRVAAAAAAARVVVALSEEEVRQMIIAEIELEREVERGLSEEFRHDQGEEEEEEFDVVEQVGEVEELGIAPEQAEQEVLIGDIDEMLEAEVGYLHHQDVQETASQSEFNAFPLGQVTIAVTEDAYNIIDQSQIQALNDRQIDILTDKYRVAYLLNNKIHLYEELLRSSTHVVLFGSSNTISKIVHRQIDNLVTLLRDSVVDRPFSG